MLAEDDSKVGSVVVGYFDDSRLHDFTETQTHGGFRKELKKLPANRWNRRRVPELDDLFLIVERINEMLTERKKTRKTASSAITTGRKIMNAGAEVIQNTDSVDHWDFLDKIEAPMWADLSICNLTNDKTDESWFETSHQFHECSSSQLPSTIFHPDSITIQEPPPSVSKSRGKNYKTKSWGQSQTNNQHPLKTLSMNPSKILTSSNNPKPTSSCESGVTDNDTSRPKISKSSLCSSSTHEQKHEGSAMSSVTSDLLSSLRNNLRRSCATRPAARMVANGGKSSVSSFINQNIKNVTRVSQPLKNKSKVENVKSAPVRNVGKVLMPRKVNEQCKETEKRSMKKSASVKVPTNVQKVTEKNGNKKVIGLKQEKTDTRNKDKGVSVTRKVYFR
ncbi:hypothetical protein LXL04_016441 [Taraxacum kok-saghyz]